MRFANIIASKSQQLDKCLWSNSTKRTQLSLEPLVSDNTNYCFIPRKVNLLISQLGPGGAERQLVNTAIGLKNSTAYEPEVLCANLSSFRTANFMQNDLTEAGIAVRQVSTLSIAGLPHNALQKLDLVAHTLRSDPDLAELIFRTTGEIFQSRPHIVHAWMDDMNVISGIAALILGVPRIILGCRNMAPTHFRYYRPSMRPLYELLSRSKNVQFINNSNSGAVDYARWLGNSSLDTVIVSNGVDTAKPALNKNLDLFPTRHNKYHKGANPIVGYIGRFSPEKCPILWLKVARLLKIKLPSIQFLLFGTGPLERQVEKTIARFGLTDCTTLGGLSYEPASVYPLMDCFLLTSKFEGIPNVVLEAQHHGVPIVTRNAGGVNHALIDGTTGIIVHGSSPAMFADAVITVLTEQSYHTDTREQGPLFINKYFNIQDMVRKTVDAYNHNTVL